VQVPSAFDKESTWEVDRFGLEATGRLRPAGAGSTSLQELTQAAAEYAARRKERSPRLLAPRLLAPSLVAPRP